MYEQAEVAYREVVGFPGYRIGSDGTVWTCWRLHKNPGRLTGWGVSLTAGFGLWHPSDGPATAAVAPGEGARPTSSARLCLALDEDV